MRIMGPSSPRCGASAAARSLARPSPAVGRPGEACALHTLPPRGLCSARRGPTSEPDFVWRSCCGAKSMLRRLLLWCAIAWAGAGAAAAATDYPTKPVQLIVPFAGGGAVDSVARLLSDPMSRSLGKAVVIDNRGGAGGVIGMDAAAHAPADGYTVLLAHSGFAAMPGLYAKLPFDPV